MIQMIIVVKKMKLKIQKREKNIKKIVRGKKLSKQKKEEKHSRKNDTIYKEIKIEMYAATRNNPNDSSSKIDENESSSNNDNDKYKYNGKFAFMPNVREKKEEIEETFKRIFKKRKTKKRRKIT